jgi:hypothetical protein
MISSEEAPRILAEGSSLLGPGWAAVDTFEDLSDYETEEEVFSSLLHVTDG